MNTFLEYFSFYYVSLTFFALFGLILLLKFIFRSRKHQTPLFEFESLNDAFEKETAKFESLVKGHSYFPSKAMKLLRKQYKKEQKEKQKKNKQEDQEKIDQIAKALETSNLQEVEHEYMKKTYVIDFEGDILAKPTTLLRQQISFILSVASKQDEVVVRLGSPGGGVPQYGLAASQLERIKLANIRLVVCVDIVAASGGYLMASVADWICAAPFAYIGSIGVVAGIPNVNRLMKKNDIDYHLFTAGQYKRTVTPFTEVTEEGKEKFQESLVEVYGQFCRHITKFRPDVEIEQVATGEFWLAEQAKEKGLVDEITSSDDYLTEQAKERHVIWLKPTKEKSVIKKFLKNASILFQQNNPLQPHHWISYS